MDEITRIIESPVGSLAVVATAKGLARIDFTSNTVVVASGGDDVATIAHLDAAEQQLGEYFAGHRTRFELVLRPAGTEFQLAAWAVLRTIPFGATMSYVEQALAMGRPRAARAVGAANGRNPLAIVVPCHRVVGSGGGLTGYAGGIERKAWLLAHEQRA